MLFAVPMKGLGACPAFPIDVENDIDVPMDAIGDQDLGRLAAVFSVPQNDQTERMGDVG